MNKNYQSNDILNLKNRCFIANFLIQQCINIVYAHCNQLSHNRMVMQGIQVHWFADEDTMLSKALSMMIE